MEYREMHHLQTSVTPHCLAKPRFPALSPRSAKTMALTSLSVMQKAPFSEAPTPSDNLVFWFEHEIPFTDSHSQTFNTHTPQSHPWWRCFDRTWRLKTMESQQRKGVTWDRPWGHMAESPFEACCSPTEHKTSCFTLLCPAFPTMSNLQLWGKITLPPPGFLFLGTLSEGQKEQPTQWALQESRMERKMGSHPPLITPNILIFPRIFIRKTLVTIVI